MRIREGYEGLAMAGAMLVVAMVLTGAAKLIFGAIPTGSYCNVTLDSGEKIIVSHQAGGRGASAGARLTVDRLKLLGFSSETVVQIDLDTAEGKAALAGLTKERTAATRGPVLRFFVASIQGCASVAEVVARCQQLLQGR